MYVCMYVCIYFVPVANYTKSVMRDFIESSVILNSFSVIKAFNKSSGRLIVGLVARVKNAVNDITNLGSTIWR